MENGTTLESIGKEARKLLKQNLSKINKNILMRTKNIHGYIEPKNVEIVFNCYTLPEKLEAMKAYRKYMGTFRKECFERGI